MKLHPTRSLRNTPFKHQQRLRRMEEARAKAFEERIAKAPPAPPRGLQHVGTLDGIEVYKTFGEVDIKVTRKRFHARPTPLGGGNAFTRWLLSDGLFRELVLSASSAKFKWLPLRGKRRILFKRYTRNVVRRHLHPLVPWKYTRRAEVVFIPSADISHLVMPDILKDVKEIKYADHPAE